jgi:hypothetical protein
MNIHDLEKLATPGPWIAREITGLARSVINEEGSYERTTYSVGKNTKNCDTIWLTL